MQLESLVSEGKVWAPRVPASVEYESASHPEDGVVVDQAKRSLVPKVRPSEAWSRVPSHAHAHTIMEMGPGYPESAQPSTAMQTKRQTIFNSDGLPEHDPPKDPWFAKEYTHPFHFLIGS